MRRNVSLVNPLSYSMALFRVLCWTLIFTYIDNHIKVMQQKNKVVSIILFRVFESTARLQLSGYDHH